MRKRTVVAFLLCAFVSPLLAVSPANSAPSSASQIAALEKKITNLIILNAKLGARISALESNPINDQTKYKETKIIWLTLTGLKDGCGINGIGLTPFTIPNSPVEITPCVGYLPVNRGFITGGGSLKMKDISK